MVTGSAAVLVPGVSRLPGKRETYRHKSTCVQTHTIHIHPVSFHVKTKVLKNILCVVRFPQTLSVVV